MNYQKKNNSFLSSIIKASSEQKKGKYLIVYPTGKELNTDLHGAFVTCNSYYRLGKGNLQCLYWSEKFNYWLDVKFVFRPTDWMIMYLRYRNVILERKHFYSYNYRDFR
jgi:hypothetical protein